MTVALKCVFQIKKNNFLIVVGKTRNTNVSSYLFLSV